MRRGPPRGRWRPGGRHGRTPIVGRALLPRGGHRRDEAGGRAGRPGGRVLLRRGPPDGPRRPVAGARRAGPSVLDGRCRGRRDRAVGVGCGGPMTPAGRPSRRSTSPAGEGSRCGPAPRADRARRVGRQRRQGTGSGRGLVRRGARGVDDYIAMVVSTGVGGGIVLDGRLLDGAGRTPATSAISSWSRTGGPARAGAGAAWRRRRRGWPSPPSPAARRPRPRRRFGGAPAGWSVARWRTCACCSTSASPWWRARWPSATARSSSPPRRRSSTSGRGISYARGARIVPAGLGADGPLVGAAAVARRALATAG